MKRNIDVRPPELYLISLDGDTDLVSVAPSCTNLVEQSMKKILIFKNISNALYETFDYKEGKVFCTVSNKIWSGSFNYKIFGDNYIMGGVIFFKKLNFQ